MFYLVVIAYLVPFISCLLLFVSCSWPCAMLWAGPNWTGRAQCLQSGCCSLSLSPVFYPQVAMSWSWLTAAASHLRAAVGSELAMISKLASPSSGGGNTCLSHKCSRDLMVRLSPSTPAEVGRKIFLDLHIAHVLGLVHHKILGVRWRNKNKATGVTV